MWGFLGFFIILGLMFRRALMALPSSQAVMLLGILLFLALFLYWSRKQTVLLILLVLGTIGLHNYLGKKVLSTSESQLYKVTQKAKQAASSVLSERQAQTKAAPSHEELFAAIDQQDESEIKRLLAAGADPNAKRLVKKGNRKESDIYLSALQRAFQTGSVPIIQDLVHAGADVSCKRNQGHPLGWAVSIKSLELVRLLLSVGADPNCPYILDTAIEQNLPEIVRELVRAGANLDERIWRKVLWGGYADIIDVFLQEGYQNVNPVEMAAYQGDIPAITRFLENRQQTHSPAYADSLRVLTWAAAGGQADIVRLLLENPQEQAEKPEALRVAILANRTEVIPLLFTPNTALPDSKLFVMAVERGHVKMVKRLFELGVQEWKSSKTDMDETPLAVACRKGNLEMVKLLLSAGERPDEPHNPGNIPLHLAIHSGNLEVVQTLVESGADVNELDYSRKTPLRVALWLHKDEIADYLRAHGAHE